MKSFHQELWFEVPARNTFVSIKPVIEQCLAENGMQGRLRVAGILCIC